MFSNQSMMVEDNNTVRLQNVTSSEMGDMLKFIYTRQLELNDDNVIKLLHASDYLNILDVHTLCVAYLKSSLSPMNVLTIRQFARLVWSGFFY